MVGFFPKEIESSQYYVERCFLNIIYIEWTSPGKDVFFFGGPEIGYDGRRLNCVGIGTLVL